MEKMNRKDLPINKENMHPSYIEIDDFPEINNIKIVHAKTGHVYIRPKNNFRPFTKEEEDYIKKQLDNLKCRYIKKYVKSDFTQSDIKLGYGFRLY